MSHRSLHSIIALLIILVSACKAPADQTVGTSPDPEPYEYALVLHGGAGNMNFQSVPEPYQEMFKHALDSALQLGLDELKGGWSQHRCGGNCNSLHGGQSAFQCRERSCFYQ